MKFKNEKQRKAVMCKLSCVQTTHNNPKILNANKNKSYSQLKKRGIILHPNKDADGDGVKNKKDCKPLDPKKQGKLHDAKLAILRKMEERLENKREAELKKLEDIKDKLKEKQRIASKKDSIRQTQLKQKQALIDEIDRERKKTEELVRMNREAQNKLDDLTITGRAKKRLIRRTKAAPGVIFRGSKTAINATNAFFHKKSTKKVLKKTGKFLFG